MKKFTYFVCASILSGCSMIPGMHMSEMSSSMPDLRIIPITPESVRADAAAAAVKTKTSPSAATLAGKDYKYRIGPHDVLAVTVWDHPEITIPAGEYRSAEEAGYLVAEDGTIFFPYSGTIKVAGKTVSEVRAMLTKDLSKIIENPQIDIKVVAFRSQKAFVSGEVVKPGPLPITDVPLTVADAIGLSGNFTPDADISQAVFTHNGKTSNIDLLAIYGKGDARQNILLTDGDIIYVPDRRNQKVYVVGEVSKPMPVQMNIHGLSLTEALGEVGGVDPTSADAEQIFVVRADGDKSLIYHLDAESPDALVLGDQFKLRPQDVVFVEATAGTRFSRTMDQMVSMSFIIRNIGSIFVPINP